MRERPSSARILPAIVAGLWLAACAGNGTSGSGSARPDAAETRPVLESVNPVHPDDRAAAARRAWLERQAAARRGAPAAGAPAPSSSEASPGIEKGTPGKLLIFSSVTGHVPSGGVRRATAGTPEQRESERVAELERALDAERAREERPREAGAEVSAPPPASTGAGVLVAPPAPPLPALDPALLVSETTSVPAGSWGNAEDLPVVRRSLDRDANGRPEEIRYFDVTTNALLRREEDRDLDGNTDAWSRFERGELVERVLDTNADGRPDEWETYAAGQMTLREVDSNGDGAKDASYRYQYESLVELRRDTDGDGLIDHVEHFERRMRVQAIDDTNRDERMDTWTTYQVVGGQEVAVRIERDSKGIGRATVFETYRAATGPPQLEKLEEDLDGDGVIDVTREYEPGGAETPEQPAPL